MFKFISSAVLLIFLASCVNANAAAIGVGVNFTGTSGQTGIALNPTDVAGVVPISYYNNFTATSGTLRSITDSTGTSIPGMNVFVSSTGGTAYAGDTNSVPATTDGTLMKGYLTTGSTPGVGITYTVTVSIPSSFFTSGGEFAGGFDLLVYSQNSSPNDYMVSSFSVAGVTTYIENAPVPSGNTFNGTYVQSTLSSYPSNNSQIGDYARFDNLTEANLSADVLTITFATLADAPGSANTYERGAFNGFELVAVPEPASLAILSAAIFLGSWRRR